MIFAGSSPKGRHSRYERIERKRPKNGLRLSSLPRMVAEISELTDAYSALLGGVRLNTRSNSGNAILITRTQPSDGNTTVAAGLATTASPGGERVLLIDGDLRRRGLGLVTGIANAAGPGEILAGGAEVAEAVHVVTPSTSWLQDKNLPNFSPRLIGPRCAGPFGLIRNSMVSRISLIAATTATAAREQRERFNARSIARRR
jgi:Mrp family chromosome partitioning ATPase